MYNNLQSIPYQQSPAISSVPARDSGSAEKQKFDEIRRTSARFNASRSFDIEDDIEFCPIITEEELQLKHRITNGSGSETSFFGINNLFPSSSPYTLSNGLLVGNPQSSVINTSPLQHPQIPDYMAMNSAVSMTAGSAAYLGSPGARQIMLSNPQGISNANRNRQGFMMMDGSAIQANTANMNMGNIPSNGMSNGNSVNRSTTPNGGSRGGMYYFGQR